MKTRQKDSGRLRLPWYVTVLLVLFGAASSLLGRNGYSWGMSILVAVCSITLPAIRMRPDFKDRRHFWITVLFLVLTQIPLVIAAQPMIERYRFLLALAFACVDLFFVAVILVRASSATRGS